MWLGLLVLALLAGGLASRHLGSFPVTDMHDPEESRQSLQKDLNIPKLSTRLLLFGGYKRMRNFGKFLLSGGSLLAIGFGLLLLLPGEREGVTTAGQPAIVGSYGRLPLSFEANQGQTATRRSGWRSRLGTGISPSLSRR